MADLVAREHELDMARRFVEFLNRERGTSYGLPESHEAPDAIARDPQGREIGIEVTCPDYSQEEARNTWMIARGKPELSTRYVGSLEEMERKLNSQLPLQNFTQRLIANAQLVIDDHCLRSYGLPTYLAVDISHAILAFAEIAPLIVPRLCVPSTSHFEDICVALTPNSTAEVDFFRVASPCA